MQLCNSVVLYKCTRVLPYCTESWISRFPMTFSIYAKQVSFIHSDLGKNITCSFSYQFYFTFDSFLFLSICIYSLDIYWLYLVCFQWNCVCESMKIIWFLADFVFTENIKFSNSQTSAGYKIYVEAIKVHKGTAGFIGYQRHHKCTYATIMHGKWFFSIIHVFKSNLIWCFHKQSITQMPQGKTGYLHC